MSGREFHADTCVLIKTPIDDGAIAMRTPQLGEAPHGFKVGDYITLVLRDGSREAGVITSVSSNCISISRKDV